MDDLVIHSHTKAQLSNFVADPSHALLLVGSAGMGKRALAEGLAAKILNLNVALAQYPYFLAVSPEDKGSISIEKVREIQKFLQLKTVGEAPLRRVVLIEQAGGLTTEAQNALLKLLEEPPSDTLIILTSDNKRSLLPTILSRAQAITVHAPEDALVSEYFTQRGKDGVSITQARFLSGGVPGLMSALLEGDEEHPLLGSVRTAKELLRKNTFERLAMVDALAKQKSETSNLLEALMRMSLSALSAAASKQDTARLKQWHNIRKEVLSAQIALSKSANAKLVLTKMLLHV